MWGGACQAIILTAPAGGGGFLLLLLRCVRSWQRVWALGRRAVPTQQPGRAAKGRPAREEERSCSFFGERGLLWGGGWPCSWAGGGVPAREAASPDSCQQCLPRAEHSRPLVPVQHRREMGMGITPDPQRAPRISLSLSVCVSLWVPFPTLCHLRCCPEGASCFAPVALTLSHEWDQALAYEEKWS